MKLLKQFVLAGVVSMLHVSLYAQESLPSKGFPLVVASGQNVTLPSGENGTFMIPVYGQNFSVTSNEQWLRTNTGKNCIELTFSENKTAGQRSAVISIVNSSNTRKEINVVQPGNSVLDSAVSNWIRIFPSSSNANQAQPGAEIEKTQDSDYNTSYHSRWDISISESSPAILTYNFDTPQHIDLVNYVPSNGNGKFGEVDIYYKRSNDSDYRLLGEYDFKMSNTPTSVYFGENGMDDIASVQFRVKTGYSFIDGIDYYASCVEMEFKQKLSPGMSYAKKISGITGINEGVPAQNGEDISRTLDNNYSTLFHTAYSNNPVSADNPAILTYTLNEAKVLGKVVYVPRKNLRSDGTFETNGNFGNVSVFYQTETGSEFVELITKDFGMVSTNTEIDFSSVGEPVKKVRFVVSSGAGNFASCAEMEFYETARFSDDYDIFGNGVFSELADGVTQDDIDNLTDPLARELAQDIFDNVYDTEYRVAEYPCLVSPQTLSEEWNTPGKLYDQLQGVTGINISKGKNVVIVSGANPNVPLALKVVSWYNGEKKEPAEKVYSLTNGINIIDFDGDYDGLAYISYYANSSPELYGPVTVHFVYGQVNGYLSNDKTNEEMHEICANAKNTCMDLVGEHVHSIWTANGLHSYCKASDGTSIGYRQYMNLLDSLISWEHQLLGFKKYNRVPTNKTMAYVNYTYYMFQGNYGVSFEYTQEQRVLNCKTLMYYDSDAIWGLSHEWGHQHQMQPYFCWAGLGESSNNMNSCYNVLHMGYSGEQANRIQNNWNAAYNHLFEGATTTNGNNQTYQYIGENRGNYIKNGENYEAVADGTGDYVLEVEKYGPSAVATKRNMAYKNIDDFSWCPAIQDAIRTQFASGSRIPDFSNTEKTTSTSELYVEENTAAFFMLYCYFSNKGNTNYVKDFQEDLYEALRQTDNANGSVIEKQNGVDKYELLASAHNGNKNGKYAEFKNSYLSSCWNTKGYLTENLQWTQNSVPFIFNYIRKASRLCGYNLFDYFDKMGFLRTIILAIDDYGIKYYALTDDMKAEFKADMEALGLKPLTSGMIKEITSAHIPSFETPVIPN